MRQTLLLIPHEIAGIPVFGFGWLLGGLAVLLVCRLLWARRRGESVAGVLAAEGMMWGLAGAVIAVVLPVAELEGPRGQPVGMAIRGYGVMLLLGIASGVALAAYRARRAGLSPEIIYGLAPWSFVGGIVGARLFYVIQYRDEFYAATTLDTIRNMLVFTEGGLVVYGAIIGGFAASVFYIWRHSLPLLKLGDVIIPCIFLGMFFGRLGCLLNGCCYGGRCEPGPVAVRFPPGSPVYSEQLASGELIGVEVDAVTGTIRDVRDGSLADRAGIEPGRTLELIRREQVPPENLSRPVPREDVPVGLAVSIDGSTYRWSPGELPDRALPVVAAQLFSSLGGLALCLSLLAVSRWVHRPGALMLLGLAGYAVLRFGLEIVRVDEAGRFGTELSISQWVSILVLIAAAGGLVWLYRHPLEDRSEQAATT